MTLAAESTNLIKNGSFEQGMALPETSRYVPVDDKAQAIAGWTVSRGTVDICQALYWEAAEGSRSLDLNGNNAGGVSQTLATTPGTLYQVEFALACNPAATAAAMRVEVRSSKLQQSQDFKVSSEGHSLTQMGWQRHAWQFTAQDTSTTIEFYSLTDGPSGPALDDVKG